MSLHDALPIVPPKDSRPEAFAAYWLSVSETEYQARHYDAATAAATIASSWYQRAALVPQLEIVAEDLRPLASAFAAELAARS